MEKSEAEDVTAEQPTNEKNGIEFREGTKLEAKDHLGDKWWEAKVLEVDSDGHEVLVHFIGWNGRHDEWIKMDSPRLQPFNRSSRRHSGGSVCPASTTQTPVSSSGFKEFNAGEKVMALWTNSCKYPAEILTKEPDGSYLVQFYDGYKKALRGHLIRRVQPDDLPFIDNCKTELAAQMKGQSNGDAKPMELRRPTSRRASAESRGSRETSPDLSPPPVVVTCEKRRERKKKFNVREVLNLKGERESRTPEPDSKSKKVLDDSEVGRNSSRVCQQSSEDSLADENLCKSSLVQEKLSKSSDEKISKSSSSNQSNYVKDVKKDSENNVSDVEEALISVGWDAVKKSDDMFVNDFNEHARELDSNSVDGKDESVTDSVEALTSVTDADDVSEKKKSKALEKIERQKKVVEREIEKRRFYEGFPGSDGEECNHNNVSEDSEVCLKCDKNSPIRTGKVDVDLIQPVNLSDSPSQQLNQTLTESVDTGSEGTPSEKENLPGRTLGLNSVNLSKVDEKNKNRVPRGSLSKEPILQDSLFPEIKGKRARKRKRFADEEPEFPVSKITKNFAAKKLPEARLPSSPSTKPRNSKSTKTDSSKLRTRSKSRDTALETLTPKKRKRHSDRPVKKDSKKALPLDSSMKSKEKLVTKKTNSVVRTTNSIVKTTNSIVKTTQSVIKSTNASAKTSNSVVKSTNAVKTTNTVVKTTSPIAKAVDKVADTIKQPSDNNIHKYLTIDFSLSPTEISKQLVEGVTIPGATEPLVMSSPKLPVGWQKKVLRRALGTSAGKWEVFIENTNGKSFKSRVELTKHFEVEKLNFNIDDFDFCLDSTLKKLRQIWKTHLSNSTNETSKQEMSEDPVLKGLSVDQGEVLTDVVEKSEVVVVDDIPKVADSSVISVKSDDNKSDVKVSLSADKSKPASVEKPKPSFNPVERPKLTIPSAQNSRILAQNKGNSTVAGSAVTGNISDTGQGVRCPLKNCNKLFRNEKLLQMHVKHYHPEYNQLVAHSPSVTDLAFHRTRLGLNFQELETGGTFQETLKKAERKVERQISKHGGAQISKPPDPISSPTIKRPISSQPTNSTVSPNTPVTNLPSPPSSSPPKPAEPLESPKKIKPEKDDKKAVKKRKHSPEEGLKSPGAAQPEKKVKTMLPQKKTESLGSLESVVPDGNGGVQQQQQQGPESEAKKVTRGRPRRDTNTETPSKPIIKMEPTPTTKTRPKRIRNDSILSVGSESTLAHLTPPTSPAPLLSTRPPPTPSTPPTYRVSKRRQLQLHGQGEGAEEKEVEEKEKEKEEEEVVNCGCGRNEEDGLMIQCDICLCWQHGLCLEIHKEEQVPEKYICAICRKPRFARQSVLYTVDQDWLKEGRLTYLPSSPPRHSSPPAPASPPPPLTNREAEFKKLSDLMADLSSMSAVLHSLRVKLAVAGQASNPKVFMWSSPWESSAPSTPPPNQDEAWQRGAAWEGPGARQPFLFPADIPDNPGDFMAAAETQLGLKQNSLQHIQQNSLQHIQQNSLQQIQQNSLQQIQQNSLQHIQQNSLQQIQQNSLQQNMSALMQQKPIQNASLQSESDNTLTDQQSEMSKETKLESESAENSVEVKGSDKAALVNNASSNSRDAESALGDPSQRIVDKSAAEPSAEESCQRNQRRDDPTAAAFSTSKDPGVSESKSSEQGWQGTSGGGSDSEKSGISQSPVPEVLSENLLHETEKQNDFSQSNSSAGKHLINGEIQDNLTERASKSEANGVNETNASDDKDLNKASCQEREDALNCCPPSDAPTNEANLCLSDSSFHQNESTKHIDDSSSSFPASVDNSQNSFNEMNDSGQSNDDLSDYISGIKDVFDFPTNLIPSVSEVQRLLPGIIQSVTGGGLEDPNESFDRDVSSFRLPPNVIVEPKRLDREECRVNLIQHVENLQGLVEDSFDKIEARLIALESGEEVPPLHETDTHFPRAKSVLILLLRDLKTAKKLNLSLPEKI